MGMWKCRYDFPQDNYLIFPIIMKITDQYFIIVIFKQVVSCPAGFTNCTLSTFKHTRTECRLMTVGRRGARKNRVLSRRKPGGFGSGRRRGRLLPTWDRILQKFRHFHDTVRGGHLVLFLQRVSHCIWSGLYFYPHDVLALTSSTHNKLSITSKK